MKKMNCVTRHQNATANGLYFSFVLCALSALPRAYSGDLNPPPGPVAPTMKPLTEIEPRIAINETNTPGDADSLYVISQPGSYYLTGDITGEAGKHGVEITASGVTLDLMGFDLSGVAGSLDGVNVSAASTVNVSIGNGSVRNWDGDGVDLANASGIRLADLRAAGNTGIGIRAGNIAIVTGCSARSNVRGGITTGEVCTITNCVAESNPGVGTTLAHGISTGRSCTIANCSVQANGGIGIATGAASAVTNCTARQNTQHGIFIDSDSTITNSSATGNNVHGIVTNHRSTIINCTASANVQDGIRVASECTVRGNTGSTNGNGGVGAGVHATSHRNRIEANNVLSNDFGILLDNGVVANFVVSNYASGNPTEYQHPASNNYIGTVILTGTAAMNSAANSLINVAF